MPSSLLPLVCICFSHPWHLLLLRLGISTQPPRQCLHVTRDCGLCHHPSPSNSGNVPGHHLAGGNETGCWLSFVSFVASFSPVQFCHPCHLFSYSRWLCPLIWTWNSTMFLSPSPTFCGFIDHRAFFKDSSKRPPMLCVLTAKRAPSSIRLGATWRSLLMRLSTSAFCCVVCSPIALPNSACASAYVRNVVSFKAASIGWINVSLSVGHSPPWPVAWLCWPSSAAPSFDASALPHRLSLSLDCFCCASASALRPNSSLLASLFVGFGLCPYAWLVTISLEAALHQVLRVLS